MSDMSVEKFVKVPVARMLYNRSPVVQESLVDRRPDRFFSLNGRNAEAGSTLSFEISSDAFYDPLSATLNFKLTTTDSGEISNAVDVVSQISIFYNDTLLERISQCNSHTNSFLFLTANQTYLNSEADVMLGNTNQFHTSSNNGTRYYSVPLSLVSGFHRTGYYIPLVGNKLKIEILLEQSNKVVSKATATTATYSLSDISLTADIVVSSQKHRDAVIQAMREDSIRIPFTSLTTGILQGFPSTENYLKISCNNSNNLSLFLLYNSPSKTLTADKWNLYHQSFALPSFSRLRVRSGTKMFTPSDDIQGSIEAFKETNKCVSGFNQLSGSGVMDYATYTGSYTQGAEIAKTTYGHHLLAVNMEKTLDSDDDPSIVNNGSASGSDGMTNEIDCYVTTSSPLENGSSWLYAIAHKRQLVFSKSSVMCEF